METKTPLPTEFAPAERESKEQIKKESEHILAMPYITTTLDAIPYMVMILNSYRQIVFANRVTLAILQQSDTEELFGLRPGEVLDCENATKTEGGCGTTKDCKNCGAVLAILNSFAGKISEEECRVIGRHDGKAINLRVNAVPVTIGEGDYSIVSATDISDEKWRRMLEQIFFHDVLNKAGGVKGLTELIGDIVPKRFKKVRELSKNALEGVNGIIEEIQSQRDLMGAEKSELTANINGLDSLEILKEVSELYQRHKVAMEKNIKLDKSSQAVEFKSDRILLKRIIGNMTKNALEACEKEQSVTMGCRHEDGGVVFWVHNMNYMPEDVQGQMFKRSFSTKGASRGLGTYSIKLLGERYLEGKVWFESTIQKGTTFYISLPA